MADAGAAFWTDVTTGQWVLLVAVLAAVAFGAWRAVTDGRFRGSRDSADVPAQAPVRQESAVGAPLEPTQAPEPASLLAGTPYAESLGERATLLQFSSAFCAPCRATRRVLGEVTELVSDVAHVEVDAEEHLELVRRLGVTRTPTTLVLDPTGREVLRAQGAPTKQQVLTALAGLEP